MARSAGTPKPKSRETRGGPPPPEPHCSAKETAWRADTRWPPSAHKGAVEWSPRRQQNVVIHASCESERRHKPGAINVPERRLQQPVTDCAEEHERRAAQANLMCRPLRSRTVWQGGGEWNGIVWHPVTGTCVGSMERAGRSGRSGRRCRPLVSHGTTRGPRLQGLGELLDREIARDARAGIVDQVRRAKGVAGDTNFSRKARPWLLAVRRTAKCLSSRNIMLSPSPAPVASAVAGR